MKCAMLVSIVRQGLRKVINAVLCAVPNVVSPKNEMTTRVLYRASGVAGYEPLACWLSLRRLKPATLFRMPDGSRVTMR